VPSVCLSPSGHCGGRLVFSSSRSVRLLLAVNRNCGSPFRRCPAPRQPLSEAPKGCFSEMVRCRPSAPTAVRRAGPAASLHVHPRVVPRNVAFTFVPPRRLDVPVKYRPPIRPA
jgi:hypothetical protein